MLTKEEFIFDVLSFAGKLRKSFPQLRHGQAVFDVIDQYYGDIARICQFEHHIDCYYDDSKIADFVDKCYELYSVTETKL